MRPLFGTAMARSGGGLLSHLMSAHPQVMLARHPFLSLFQSWRNAVVATAGDSELSAYAGPQAPLSDYYFSDQGLRLLDLLLEQAEPELEVPSTERQGLGERSAERAAFESADLVPLIRELDADTYRGLLDGGLSLIALARGCEDRAWVGFQEPWIVDFLPALGRSYRDAKFIVLLRDPRAVITSMKGIVHSEPAQVVHALSYARHWRKYATLAHHYTSEQPVLAGRVLVVRYEDLILTPKNEATRLAAFLGLEFHPSMIDPGVYHDWNTGASWHGNSSFTGTGEGLDSAAAERWRERAEPALVEAVEFLCGPEMGLWGYGEFAEGASPTATAIRYLVEDAGGYSAWRSDLGDVQHDIGFELFRAVGLALPDGVLDTRTVRRSFLFEQTYRVLRKSTASLGPGDGATQ